MDQWDYLEAYVYQDEWVDTSGRRAKLTQSFKVRDAIVYFTSATLLEELGAEGWELVSVAYVDMTLYRIFLKRRKVAVDETPSKDLDQRPHVSVEEPVDDMKTEDLALFPLMAR
jgi:hypothetical protein